MENNNFSWLDGNNEFKRVINQYEAMELIAAGRSLDDHTVVDSKQVNLTWKGQDGKTLMDCIKADNSGAGFLILVKHMEVDFPTCIAYLGSHWSMWRDNIDKLVKK